MIDILENLLSLTTENEVVEFKEAKTQYDKNKLGKYFSALSNEANLKDKAQAWLLFGVKNDKSVVGTTINDHQINEYKSEMANHTSPNLSFVEVHRINYKGSDVLMLEIPAAPQGNPVSWKGFWYGRDGESLGALNLIELDSIRIQNKFRDWSAQIIDTATLDDLDTRAIDKAREMFGRKNPNLKEEIANWEDTTFLNKAKITIQGQITNTAILLLGKSESEHFLSPATSKMSWILRDKDGISKNYHHFFCPILLEAEQLKSKIRILKYRYLRGHTLFPDEVDQYDPYVIRETLNNCIAHQDYTLGGKINVVEREDGELIFSNSGSFIPETIWNVLESNSPAVRYRNPHLANAMVNLNMIDTIGSGILKIFQIQKEKFFPLPDYSFKNQQVEVQIYGKVLNLAFAEKLATYKNLTLKEIFLLDRVAKGKNIEDGQAKELRKKKLIEGRKPNYMLSSNIAEIVGTEATYIQQKGMDDDYYANLILEYLKKFETGARGDFNRLLIPKLPDVLNESQKENKVKNLLQKLKKARKIKVNSNRKWELTAIS